MQQPPGWGPQQGGYGPPPSGYGPGYGPPQQGGYGPPQGYGPGYGPGFRPPNQPWGAGKILLVVGLCLFGGCVVLAAIGNATGHSSRDSSRRDESAAKSDSRDRDDSPSTRNDPAPTPPPEKPALTVSADKLFQDYQSNEVAADDIYKGKRFRLTGSVEGIDKDFTDSVVVRITTSDAMGSISANGLDKSFASKLRKGQKISIVCEGIGMVLNSPVLDDCKP